MSQTYKFGTVEVRPDERQILVEGSAATVGARAFDLLLALIDQRDRVVSKNELLDKVWPGLVVEENNLQVQVSTLRKILGNGAIATLPGRGYRFTVPLEIDTPAPAPPLPGGHNLPAQLNSFIGREAQIAQLKEALVNARLVTLTGTGGTGKSRLSLQVAEQVTPDYPDGVWLAELSPVTDPARVPQVVAFAMHVKEQPGVPLAETLADFARPRKMLLVLDNCEHLVAGCAELVRRLLLAAPLLKIMASSREALQITGETRFPVPALDIATEAVRLFVDRAAAVEPRFQLTPASEPVVVKICERLDGIPLAIELAAARVGAMPVERIAVMLNECFRVLTKGDRAAPTRQQTLRASIDWSYDLLSIPERMLLRRLAVFAGGWTLEAAEAVVAGGDVQADEVVDWLTQLVEKSLVELDERGERYRLLDTVRQYAAELLQASGEAVDVRALHVRWCVELAERTRREIGGPRQALAIAQLDTELENLLSAHAACAPLPDGTALGRRLSRGLRHYWIRGGRLGAGIQMALAALARFGPAERTEERCRALFDVGQLNCFAGQFAPARRYMLESLAIAREIEDAKSVEAALQMLGMACMGQGELDAAREHLEEAVAIAEKIADVDEMAGALNGLAQCDRMQGRLDRAEELYQKVMTLASQSGNNHTIAIALLNLAMVWIDRDCAPRARSMLLEVFSMAELTGSRATVQSVLEVEAGLAALLEDWGHAARFYGAAEAMAAATGLRRDAADESFLAPRIEKARAQLGADAFEAAEREGRALPSEGALQEARAWLDQRQLLSTEGSLRHLAVPSVTKTV